MSINLKDLKITLPDGLEKATEPAVVGNNVEFMVRATKQVSNIKISATYEDAPVVETEEITTVPAAKLTEVVLSEGALGGMILTLTSTFDSAPYLPFYSLEVVGEGVDEIEAPSISGNTIVSKHKLPRQFDFTATFNVSYNGAKPTVLTRTTRRPTIVLRDMTAEPTTVTVGQDVTITALYTNPPSTSDLPVPYDVTEGFELKTDWEISDKTATCVYTAKTEGSKRLAVTSNEGIISEVSKAITVTVNPVE